MTDQLRQDSMSDSIAAKAFEMAAELEWYEETGYGMVLKERNSESAKRAIRALSPASARRQLQLDLLRARLEEARWWQKRTLTWGIDPGFSVSAKEEAGHVAQLESEIAALEAQ